MVYGRVYSIRSHQTTDIYIGSTTQILCKRFADHRNNYKCYLNETQKYMSSYEILKHGDAYIELLFEGEFESIDALRKKEGEYQREMDCVNKIIAGRTQQEWGKQYYEENKEQILEKRKKYAEEHKEQKLTYNHDYYDKNKDKLIQQTKEYRENHKAQLAKKAKEYREKNKEQIAKKAKERYEKKKNA